MVALNQQPSLPSSSSVLTYLPLGLLHPMHVLKRMMEINVPEGSFSVCEISKQKTTVLRAVTEHQDGGNHLCKASQKGHVGITRLLLDKGAAPDKANLLEKEVPDMWMHLVLLPRSDAVDLLSCRQPTPDVSCISRPACFHIKDLRTLVRISGHRIEIEQLPHFMYGETALCQAAALGHKEVAQLLLGAGAAVDKADTDARSADVPLFQLCDGKVSGAPEKEKKRYVGSGAVPRSIGKRGRLKLETL
eukprot:1157934-Pelagomonas_calceolata.AAC.6